MIAIAGIYEKGIISLSRKVSATKPVKVVVTFLDEDVKEIDNDDTKNIDVNNFSFRNAIDATKDIHISISDALIEERRTEL